MGVFGTWNDLRVGVGFAWAALLYIDRYEVVVVCGLGEAARCGITNLKSE